MKLKKEKFYKMCTNCDNNCLEEYSDKCMLYTGPDFPKFNIKNGQHYDKVIVQLLDQLKTFCEEKVELSCVFTGECDNCETTVEIPKAVKLIVDKLCKLTSSEIKYEGEKYCIGSNSISSGAIHVLGRSFKYNVEPSVSGTSVSFNLVDVINSLPSDYRVSRVNTIISGKSKGGKSIILDSDKNAVGATIGNDRFPINLDIDLRINTPTGDVKLIKRLNIPTPMSGSYSTSFSVQDFGSDVQEEYSLESFLEGVSAQVCANKTELDSFKNLDLPGCNHVDYNSCDIRDIVAQQGSLICDILTRLEILDSINYNVCTEGCDEKSKNGSLQDSISEISNDYCNIRSELNGLSRDIQTLQDVQSSNSGTEGSGGLTENSAIINSGSTKPIGSCPNGNCSEIV